MDRVCDYCDSKYDDTLQNCPHCGAPNDFVRRAIGVPTTIEELKQWYAEKNLPPYEQTRFFIGEDYRKPRAFGIYRNGSGDYVVYKNKNDGSRAIRYQGGDEAYAVNEIYLKLKEQMAEQRQNNPGARTAPTRSAPVRKKGSKKSFLIILIIVILFIVVSSVISALKNKNGYYNINGTNYYYQNDDWYAYDNGSWVPALTPSYDGDLGDYYDGNSYSGSDDYDDFQDSGYYDSYDYDWDSDNDYDYDYGGWDSGGGDWDSDWLIRMPPLRILFALMRLFPVGTIR